MYTTDQPYSEYEYWQCVELIKKEIPFWDICRIVPMDMKGLHAIRRDYYLHQKPVAEVFIDKPLTGKTTIPENWYLRTPTAFIPNRIKI